MHDLCDPVGRQLDLQPHPAVMRLRHAAHDAGVRAVGQQASHLKTVPAGNREIQHDKLLDLPPLLWRRVTTICTKRFTISGVSHDVLFINGSLEPDKNLGCSGVKTGNRLAAGLSRKRKYLIAFQRRASRARLSLSTLTRGSPSKPRRGVSVCCSTRLCTFSTGVLRALATRVTW